MNLHNARSPGFHERFPASDRSVLLLVGTGQHVLDDRAGPSCSMARRNASAQSAVTSTRTP